MENAKSHSLFLLWLGAAISIAEIVTGTLVAPLGLKLGLLSIIIGHLIGCGLFLFPAALLSAQQQQTAIQVTRLAFGHWGVILFSLLNALQLLGWTAVMIVNAQLSMNSIAQKLFHVHSIIWMSVIVAILIVIWLLFNHDWLFRINNFVVILLAVGALLLIWTIFHTGHLVKNPELGTISFGSAVELSVTMALSWLPLIGDYTQDTRRPFRSSFASVAGYFSGSCVMFIIGLLSVVLTGETDFATLLSHSNLGLIALLIIVFSTVTTTFMDAYSAATNLKNVSAWFSTRWSAICITFVGLLIAVSVSMNLYQSFLYAIGAIFTPLFAILFTSYFVMHARLAYPISFAWWLIGVLGYSYLQKLDFVFGTTIILFLILSLGYLLTGLLTKKTAL